MGFIADNIQEEKKEPKVETSPEPQAVEDDSGLSSGHISDYPDTWTITIIQDEDFVIRNVFENWSNLINAHVGNVRDEKFYSNEETLIKNSYKLGYQEGVQALIDELYEHDETDEIIPF